MEIRKIENANIPEALKLVWDVFLEFEAPDYTEEGVDEFKRSIDDPLWISQRELYGAYEKSGKLLGVIATKDTTHIALFFVDAKYQKQGIGKALFSKVKELNRGGFFTVNSSPYAHEFYKRLGFKDTSAEQSVNGLRFYPMKADIAKQSSL